MKHKTVNNHARGEGHYRAKLTESDVRAIRASNDKQEYLAAKYGVTHAAISYIRSRRTWKHIP